MKTIEFIREHGLDELTARFGIVVKRHPKYPNLVFLKYNQIDSPMAEPIVQECRGLILDEADDWRVVSFPFTKFFNHGEPNAITVDWPTAKVYEKLDGSLMTLYWYDGAWQVASNGTPDAGGDVNGASLTFAELFWKTWKAMGYALPPDPLPPSQCPPVCFMFELMTPFNRVVVQHQESRIVLIGVRCMDGTFAELDPVPVAEATEWQCVSVHSLACIDDCLTAASKLRGIDGEGFVVCDAEFHRVKVKSPQYVALSHMKDQMTERRMLDVVRAGESTEFLTYFPEMKPMYESVSRRFEAMCAEVEAEYATLRHHETQKAFAVEAVKSSRSAALFGLRGGKVKTAKEFYAHATQPAVERAIGIEGAA